MKALEHLQRRQQACPSSPAPPPRARRPGRPRSQVRRRQVTLVLSEAMLQELEAVRRRRADRQGTPVYLRDLLEEAVTFRFDIVP